MIHFLISTRLSIVSDPFVFVGLMVELVVDVNERTFDLGQGFQLRLQTRTDVMRLPNLHVARQADVH